MKIEIKEILSANTIRITTPDERWYQEPISKEWYASSTWIADYAPKGIGFYKYLASKGWDEAEAYKILRGNTGSKVHNATEVLQKGGEVNDSDTFQDSDGNWSELNAEEYEAVMSFVEWADENVVEFLDHERTVFNRERKYAGTLDIRAKLKDGLIWVIDKKTSANVYLSHEAQIISYFNADDIVADKMGILQLGYSKNKIKKWKFTEVDNDWDFWLSCMKHWSKENDKKQPKQKDYPRKLKLKNKEL